MRQKYVFVTASKRGQKYRDYFNPNSAVQLRVMGMEDTVVRITLPQLTGHVPFLCLTRGDHCNAVVHARSDMVSRTAEPRIKTHSSHPTGCFAIQGIKPYTHGPRHPSRVRRNISKRADS